MKPPLPGQTTVGGERMEHHEFSIGAVTYEVSRVYGGKRSVVELVLERMLREQPDLPFDERHTDAV